MQRWIRFPRIKMEPRFPRPPRPARCPVQQRRTQFTPTGAVVNNHPVNVQRVIRVIGGQPVRVGCGLDGIVPIALPSSVATNQQVPSATALRMFFQ